MASERITEEIVRNKLRELGYHAPGTTICVQEQQSTIEAIRKALAQASKSGGSGVGAPEFIITDPGTSDFVLIIECKASTKDHESAACNAAFSGKIEPEAPDAYVKRAVRYAADGALHYARALSREHNVIAVAVSGQTSSALTISTYLHSRGATTPKRLSAKTGASITTLISWSDYIEHATFDPTVQAVRLTDLMAFSRELHDFMRDDVKASENEKPLFVSGTLIALRNKAFSRSYNDYSLEDLPSEWLRVINFEMDRADIPGSKKSSATTPYALIAGHPELAKPHKKYPKGVLNELIKRLNEKVDPFISYFHDFDVVGQFYGEFLKYTGGDKKALGIVLTPRHITELFSLLANVNRTSRVLDICAGTGGFLISAMHQMFKGALTKDDKEDIKQNGLVGVEQQPNMFALAVSNMILRGDGKANLYQSSCFDPFITDKIKEHNCTVGLLNPPYSQADEDSHELYFISHMLDCLERNGTGIAIVPMGCAIAPHKARAELLKYHTLEAVMSLPDELFYPVGTIACIMIFTAKIPHQVSNKKTWFGYWKDDGFIKTKHRGRVDQGNDWARRRDHWVNSYRNREVRAGESVSRYVTSDDEWCAEAYMETDYSTLRQSDFERVVRNYAIYKLMSATAPGSDEAVDDDSQ
ncbi:N-6 DNA methylase [Methylobacterium sp. Leaf469]|uniref:HsdM family class I SAM-dependent methyltransferase n=1 Tax=Methylobacterium sp. Leaf469 TaxID=1736387 RepID=UPI0009E9C3DB|nr:N-6 DNA methylase [Methylobacterium sp. Leaf469]